MAEDQNQILSSTHGRLCWLEHHVAWPSQVELLTAVHSRPNLVDVLSGFVEQWDQMIRLPQEDIARGLKEGKE